MDTSRPANGAYSMRTSSHITRDHFSHDTFPKGSTNTGMCSSETNYPLLTDSTNIATTGSARLLDMSNGGMEDSGIGMNMDHENGSQSTSVTKVPHTSDSGSMAATSSYPDHSSQVSKASSSGSKIAEIWPLKSVPKERSSRLLYGMFSKTEDGTQWQCEECKRLFSSRGSLQAHGHIHTGERPYQCQYCFRTFCQASTLRNHERLHTGEKPYKCEHCGRAFTQLAGLRCHLKTHRK